MSVSSLKMLAAVNVINNNKLEELDILPELKEYIEIFKKYVNKEGVIDQKALFNAGNDINDEMHLDLINLQSGKDDDALLKHLMSAAYWGHTDTVLALALLKKDLGVDIKNNSLTPLMEAAFKGHTDTVLALCDKGANVDIQDNNGWTAFMWAAFNGHTDTVLALYDKGANIDIQDNNGGTPLMEAAFKGHTDTVVALCDKGANVNIQNILSQTALMRAAINGHTDIVIALCDKGANIDIQDNNGRLL